jgi:hypothetical protein
MTCQLAIAEQENKEVDPEKKQIAYIFNPCPLRVLSKKKRFQSPSVNITLNLKSKI